jgi:hypothetical protein
MRTPTGLGPEGKKLFHQVTKTFDFEGEPGKIELLTQAAKVVDVIAELDDHAAEAPLTVKGSTGQQVIQPTLAEARFQRGLLAQLLGRLGLPDTDEAAAEKAEKLSQTRRRAANSKRVRYQ